MHILWVKMAGLWPATTGGRVRSLQIVSALARRHRLVRPFLKRLYLALQCPLWRRINLRRPTGTAARGKTGHAYREAEEGKEDPVHRLDNPSVRKLFNDDPSAAVGAGPAF